MKAISSGRAPLVPQKYHEKMAAEGALKIFMIFDFSPTQYLNPLYEESNDI